jgi:hypothetical protein
MRDDRKRAKLLQRESEKKEAESSEIIVISNFCTKKIQLLLWRECIKKAWEVDSFICSNCGSLIKLLSFIYEHKMIKKILAHLGLFRIKVALNHWIRSLFAEGGHLQEALRNRLLIIICNRSRQLVK